MTKAKKKDAWMPFYVGDYLRDTSRLTTEQHGAYVLLILDYWVNGPLPDNDAALAPVVKMSASQWKRQRATIAAFFSIRDGKWHHKRIDAEREKTATISGVRQAAGGTGAEQRWGGEATADQTRSQRLAEARAKGTHTVVEWSAMLLTFDNHCVKCGVAAADAIGGKLCKDHIKPIYQGGDDSIENIQPLCRSCNSGKGPDSTDLRDFAKPGWRDELAKRVTSANQNALQNDRQTPAPSPLPSPSPEETGSNSEPEPEKSSVQTASYAFSGQTIRLNQRDFDEWAKVFSAIPDLRAELAAIDAWWQKQALERRKGWFTATSGMLNRKHQEILERRKNGTGGHTPFQVGGL